MRDSDRASIKDQLAFIKSKLTESKEKLIQQKILRRRTRTDHVRIWNEHLRLLDADAENADSDEIRNRLFSDETDTKRQTDKIHERRKLAIRYRDNDYRFIPLRKLKNG